MRTLQWLSKRIQRIESSFVGEVIVLVVIAAIVALALFCPLPDPIRVAP